MLSEQLHTAWWNLHSKLLWSSFNNTGSREQHNFHTARMIEQSTTPAIRRKNGTNCICTKKTIPAPIHANFSWPQYCHEFVSLSVALSKSPGFAQLHQLHHHLLSTVGPGQREDPLDPLDADVQHTKSPKNFEGSENIYENQNWVFFQQICWFANLFCKCATNKKRFPKLHLDKEPFFWNAWMLGSLEGPDTQNTGVIQYLLVFNSDLQGKVTSPNKQKTTIIHSTAFQSQRTSSPLPLPAAAPRSPSNVPWQTIMDTAEAKATKAALGPDPHFFIPRKSMAYEFPI